MPELPEVEAARRAIEDHCIGKKIKRSVIADDSKVIDGVSPSSFKESITGKTIVAAHRKGKNMWLQLDSPPFPSFQFGMAGAIYIKGVAVTKYKRSAVNEEDEWPSKYSKLFIELDDGLELSFTDKRRFAKVCLLENPTSVPPISELGPDALLEPLTIEELSNSLSKKKIGIKTLLLDQSFISGVGNWIADEVLYQARIHPLHVAASISKESCAALHKCLKEVIGKAVEVGADSSQFPSNWIFHFREKKPGKALVDGKKIEFITAGGRTTAYVPELQKLSGAQAAKAPSKPRKGTTKTTKDEDDDNDDADEQGSEEEEEDKAVKPKGRKATTKSKVKKPPAKRKSTKDEDDDDDADEQGIEEDDKAVKSKGRKVTTKSKPKKPPTKRESKESDNESSEDENDDVEGDEQTKVGLSTRGKPKETEKGTRGNKKTNARTKAEEDEDEDEDEDADTRRRTSVAEKKTKKKAETTQTGKQTKKRAK